MKILRIIASMDPSSGGPCQGIRNSIPALKDLGVNNEVVSMDHPNAAFLGKDSFPIYALGPAKNPWAYGQKLKPWLEENLVHFDAVIAHGLWLYPGYALNQSLKRIKGKCPKLYIMPHGMLDPYFQRAETRKLKAWRNWFYWKLIERKLIHRADGILFTCEQELLLARKTFRPYQPKKELNVGYGIPEPPPCNSKMYANFWELCPQVKGKNYLLFLSRIHEKKGVDLLIQAYILIKEHNLNEELPLLVIAGPGLDAIYGRQIQQLASSNPSIKNSVFFPGMLNGGAKWGAFYGCEAFMLPSHQENFGIAVVEALACGKPVLISDKVNIWREILEMDGGLVQSDTLDGTVNLIKTWLELAPQERKKMNDKARSIYSTHFSMAPNALRFKNAIGE